MAAMDLTFYKLRLCDSDIVLIDDLDGDGRDRDWALVARALLHRRRGVGADRLAIVSKPEGELRLRVFRPDGSTGPFADAALCVARFLLDSGRSGTEDIRIRIPGADIRVDILDSASLGLSLGALRGMPDDDVLDAAAAAARATSIEAEGERFQVLPLRAGIPAADLIAVFAEGGAARARARIASSRKGRDGKKTDRENGESAPTVVAVQVASRERLLLSAPSGGAQDCSACAAAALAASAAVGYADREAMVRLGSGAIWVEWAASGSLYVAARPEYVYRGEFYLSE